MLLGLHLRAGPGLVGVVERAEAAGARSVQVFTQSPRSWGHPPRSDERFAAYRERATASRTVAATLCHVTYLVNLAAPAAEVRTRSAACLAANLAAASAMGADGLVLHPGSHRGDGWAVGADRVVTGVLRALDAQVDPCPVLFENTAGGGDTMGRTFEELGDLIERAGRDERLGVCLDSQHLFAGGTAYASPAAMDEVVRRLDAAVGLDRLKAVHINDSAVAFGSHRDRHASLGRGLIGLAGLRCFLGHPAIQGRPAVIETPGLAGGDPGRADVELARSLRRAGRRRYLPNRESGVRCAVTG